MFRKCEMGGKERQKDSHVIDSQAFKYSSLLCDYRVGCMRIKRANIVPAGQRAVLVDSSLKFNIQEPNQKPPGLKFTSLTPCPIHTTAI